VPLYLLLNFLQYYSYFIKVKVWCMVQINIFFLSLIRVTAVFSAGEAAILRICIPSIQNIKRTLLLLVALASDIALRTIKFFSVVFSSVYSSMLQAMANKHSLVCRRLCDMHCMVIHRNRFSHFAVRTSSSRYRKMRK